MSEQNKTGVITDLDDSFFENYSKKVQADSQRNSGGTSFTPRKFDPIGYAGCEKGVNKIFRMIGAPPGAEAVGYTRKNYDSKEVLMCEVKDDKGKKFIIRLPKREDNVAYNHILHRLYDKVTETVWVNKKKIYINEGKFPELWAAVTKTGYKPEDVNGWKMAAGLKSTNFVIYNVIDRQDKWCEENKHTKILCREVNIDEKDNVWAKPGLKAWGFINRLTDLQNKYKSLEKYDVAIKRTGQKDTPFELRNASIHKEKDMMDELKNADGTLPDTNIIVVGPLSNEEKAYGRYDLDKLYQPTSCTKILNRISSVFKLADACLGTKFFEELTGLSEKEKAEWKEKFGTENEEDIEEQNQAAVENKEITQKVADAAPARRASIGSPTVELSAEKIAALIGWSKITDVQKTLIKDVIIDGGKVKDIVWIPAKETENLLACECNIACPESFASCPACGADFV